MPTTSRLPGCRDHIPLYPRRFLALRAVQLTLALVVLGLGAYGVATNATSGDIFIVVAATFNIPAATYHILSLSESPTTSLSRFRVKGYPRIYNLYAVLALDAFLLCIWLSAAATLGSEVAVIHTVTRRFGRRPYGESDAWIGVVGAAAGGGGVEGLLHIISLAIHGVRVYRHRAAGGRARPGREPRAPRTLKTAVVAAGVGPVVFGVSSFPVVTGEGEKLGEEGRVQVGASPGSDRERKEEV